MGLKESCLLYFKRLSVNLNPKSAIVELKKHVPLELIQKESQLQYFFLLASLNRPVYKMCVNNQMYCRKAIKFRLWVCFPKKGVCRCHRKLTKHRPTLAARRPPCQESFWYDVLFCISFSSAWFSSVCTSV